MWTSKGKKYLVMPLCPLLIILLLSSPLSAQGPKQILSIEAYDMLNTVPDTYLIDVRTRAEYQFVGHPVNAYLFPFMFMSHDLKEENGFLFYDFGVKNPDFLTEIAKNFKKDDNLLLISRDGKRSSLAASELLRAGYKNIYNIKDGFEGPVFPTFYDRDKNKYFRQLARRNNIYGYGHRRHYGWQWWGLPWTYELEKRYLYPPDLRKFKDLEKKGLKR